MPREIVWLPGAARDVNRLRNFIQSKNPRAAQRAAKRILEGVKILQDNPEAGAPIENLSDYRDLSNRGCARSTQQGRRVLAENNKIQTVWRSSGRRLFAIGA